MSGQKRKRLAKPYSLSPQEREQVPATIRQLAGIGAIGPSDAKLVAAVEAFVQEFEYWYVRVISEAVSKYRPLLIARINPFIRRMEFHGLSSAETAARLVEDYSRRCFVTAGGWALERLAIAISPTSQKAAAEGIDIQRLDPGSGAYHLYVLKSGLVTRNSDIVSALKRNAREAERRLKQGNTQVQVVANWAVAAGKSTTTFKDGIRRPSSAEFWSEMTDLPPQQAIEVVLSVAAEAGRLVRRDARKHLEALTLLIATYIAKEGDQANVDWEFIGRLTMREKAAWQTEDRERHRRALAALRESGYAANTVD